MNGKNGSQTNHSTLCQVTVRNDLTGSLHREQLGEVLKEEDLWSRAKVMDPRLQRPEFISSLKFLKAQLIFLHSIERESETLYSLKERALNFIAGDPKLRHDDQPLKDLPEVATTRLEELKKLTEQIQSGMTPEHSDFDRFNSYLGTFKDGLEGLVSEARSGTNPLITEALVDHCLTRSRKGLPQGKWFNHAHKQLTRLSRKRIFLPTN